MSSKSCPKRRGRTSEGFTLDHTHGGYKQATWVEGPAEKRFLFGAKLKGRRQLPMSSYRCDRCGFVESYAGAR